MRVQSHRRRALLASMRTTIAAGLVVLCGLQPAFAGGWATGDVYVGISGGQYQVYDNNGAFKETIDTGLVGYTANGVFSASTSRLYTTAFEANRVVAFDATHPHAIVQTIVAGGSPESIALDSAGNIYVGHQSASPVRKYDAAGVLLATYTMAFDSYGPDELELAADDRTMFYTSEGRTIRRYDVLTSFQLPDFAVLPGTNSVGPLRLLPPFDGTGGLLVSNTNDIKRLDGTGAVVQTYDVPGEDLWFAMDLDPNGTSFWASSPTTSNVYRFHSVTGAVEIGPIHTGTGPGTLYGLIVAGGDVVLPGRFCFGDGAGATCPCGNTSPPGDSLGCTNSGGLGGGVVATGWPSLSADSIVIAGSNMPNSFALYLQGTGQVNGNTGIAFGDGLRCVGGAITRLGTKLNAAGASHYPGPGDPSVSVRGLVTAPGDRYYQVWYRDAVPFCTAATFSLTNGARVTWLP